jgi:hypothetical protein
VTTKTTTTIVHGVVRVVHQRSVFFLDPRGVFLCAHNIFKFEAKNDVTAHFSKKKKKE